MTPYYTDPWLTVYAGDCREVLPTLPAESVDCVVTSPPYWGLRDYGVPGQLGLEPTPEGYVVNLVAVFRELRRVLKPSGTAWLNLGDSYAPVNYGPNAKLRRESPNSDKTLQGRVGHWAADIGGARSSAMSKGAASIGIKPKELVGIPWRVAFALQADGWYLRSDIIWSKPNPMPESVTDRPTKSHEYLFLLARGERYYYDADAIRERGSTTRAELLAFGERPDLGFLGHSNDRRRAKQYATPNGPTRSPHGQGFTRRSNKQASGQQISGGDRYTVFNDRWDAAEEAGTAPLTRNRRSVWTVATQPYPDVHFATFPPALVEPCILAGTPPGGIVLDPFAGTGTVGLVAQRHSRRAVLIDLNPEYLRQQMQRNAQTPLGLGTEVPA